MFKDSRVIITGVSNLLGDMLARAYLKQGAHVIGIDKNDSRLEAEKYHFVKYDFVNNDSAEIICDAVRLHFDGTLDILVNVLHMRESSELQTVTLREFKEYFTESLYTLIEMNRKLYPMLLKSEQRNPSVINIGSASSRNNTMNSGLECLCAQAVIGLTRMQAGYYDGVRFNSISPIWPQDLETCQDIINAVLFLCSNDASFITGSDFLLDYGESAKNAARLEPK